MEHTYSAQNMVFDEQVARRMNDLLLHMLVLSIVQQDPTPQKQDAQSQTVHHHAIDRHNTREARRTYEEEDPCPQ